LEKTLLDSKKGTKMSKSEKIKKIVLIATGFALSTYLIMSGFAILNQDKQNIQQAKSNTTSK
jgi:amino acid permease